MVCGDISKSRLLSAIAFSCGDASFYVPSMRHSMSVVVGIHARKEDLNSFVPTVLSACNWDERKSPSSKFYRRVRILESKLSECNPIRRFFNASYELSSVGFTITPLTEVRISASIYATMCLNLEITKLLLAKTDLYADKPTIHGFVYQKIFGLTSR